MIDSPIEEFSWWKGDCIIDGENIYRSGDVASYYPFQEQKTIIKTGGSPLYNTFAYLNWNNPKELSSFASSYGLLGLKNHPRYLEENQGETFYKNLRKNKREEIYLEAAETKSMSLIIDYILVHGDFTWGVSKEYLLNLKYQIESPEKVQSLNSGLGKKWINEELAVDYISKMGPENMAKQLLQESISDWKREIIRMRWFEEMISDIDNKNYDFLKWKHQEYPYLFSFYKDLTNDNILEVAKITISKQINKEIKGINPYYFFDGNTSSIEYSCPSLLSMMYFSLLTDYANVATTFDTCEYCGRSYIKTKGSKDYCGDTCKNRAKQKRNKIRKSISDRLEKSERLNKNHIDFCRKQLEVIVKGKISKEEVINKLKGNLSGKFPNEDFSFFEDQFADKRRTKLNIDKA